MYVKELDIFLTMKVLDDTLAVLSIGKLCDENGYSYEWINGQKPHLIKDGIRLICNTEKFVPIVVPGLSTSYSSGSHHSTSMTPSRQERHCSTSSSSSSSSPTTATSSDCGGLEKVRIELKVIPLRCLCQVSMLMIERGHPLFADSGRASSEIPEWLQEFRRNLVDVKFLNTETHTPVLMKYL